MMLKRSRLQQRTSLAAVLACGIFLRSGVAGADNPIVQTYYTADPAPMVHEGRVYLYTSHDEDVTVNNFFTMNDWKLYSTIDMVNWTDHGTVASYRTFSWGTDSAWAPHGIARNGKYYLYVPLNNNTGARIGVGVADKPEGPFTDALGKALVQVQGTMNIDPTVFIDGDGQAYMYWGNPELFYVKLNADMISYQGTPTKVERTAAAFGQRTGKSDGAYQEGPWFYKRDALYYLVYPADDTPEKLSYSTSTGPTGPWKFGGDIMAKQTGAGSSFTNHPGVIDYKGKSYFFYHNGALPGGGGYKRSVCVEEFTYGADGKIPMIQMSKDGPAPVATLDPFQQVEAETIAFSSGLKTEKCTDTGGGINVNSISNGDYIKVKNVDFLDGVTSFEARVSSSTSDAKIELRIDSQTGTLLGTCDVSGASSWTTKSCTVMGGSGKHDLFMKFVGGNGDLFKFNWWKFSGPRMNGGTGGTGGMPGTAGSGGGGTAGSGAGGTLSAGGAGGASSGGAVNSGGAQAGGAPASQGGGTQMMGLGGAVGAGGAPQSGGASSGGATATLGGRTAAGGATSAGSTSTNDPAPDASGCSCRMSSRSSNMLPFAALLPLALGLRRRNRRTSSN